MQDKQGRQIVFRNAQLLNVVCQLAFPEISYINIAPEEDIASFFSTIYPNCRRQEEKVVINGKPTVVENYSFTRNDGKQNTINLTQGFISFSTPAYTSWNEFSVVIDEPLSMLLRRFKIPQFNRIGLRFINGFSKTQLGLPTAKWSDLIRTEYLGVLNDPSISEQDLMKNVVDVERQVSKGIYAKSHTGAGRVKIQKRMPDGSLETNESSRFIVDHDVYTTAVPVKDAAQALTVLHNTCDRLLLETINERLYNALKPEEV